MDLVAACRSSDPPSLCSLAPAHAARENDGDVDEREAARLGGCVVAGGGPATTRAEDLAVGPGRDVDFEESFGSLPEPAHGLVDVGGELSDPIQKKDIIFCAVKIKTLFYLPTFSRVKVRSVYDFIIGATFFKNSIFESLMKGQRY